MQDVPGVRDWRRIGIVLGLVACIVYPIAVLVPIPNRQLTVILGASFGPAFAFACWALGKVLQDRRPTIATEIAMVSSIAAGALVTAMILVQLAVQYSTVPSTDPALTKLVVHRIWDVDLGLDVAFDVFVGIGTALFGWSMLKDERFGRVIGATGMIIGLVGLLGFNFATFPVPPANAGLIDPGILTGLWYLTVVVMMIRWSPEEQEHA